MNVLFVDQYSEMGGGQHSLLDLLPGAQSRGWGCFAALPGKGPLIARMSAAGVPVEIIPCGPYSYGRKSAWDNVRFLADTLGAGARLRRIVAERSIDLVYANGPRVLASAALAGAPLLYHAHSVLRHAHERWLVSTVARRATVVAASRFVADPLRSSCTPHIVPNGADDLGFRPWSAPSEPRVGIIGRIAPEKGQHEFVEAARLLVQQNARCRFVICGEAILSDPRYARDVRAAAQGLPIEFVHRDTPAEAMQTVDILAVPSGPGEGFSRVVVEAFSAGVPVVAFAAGAIPELITHEQTGFLTPDPSAAALAALLSRLLSAPGALAGTALAARELWQQRYTLTEHRNQVLALMEEAVLRNSSQNNSPASTATMPADSSKAG